MLLSKPPIYQFQSDCLIRVFGTKCMFYWSVQINLYTTSGPTGFEYNSFHYTVFNHEDKFLKTISFVKILIMKSTVTYL